MPNSLAQAAMQGTALPSAAAPAQQKQVKLADAKDMIHKQAEVDRQLKAILKEGGPIKPKEVLEMATRLVANRTITAQQAAGYLSDLPDDPNKVREWCERHAREADQVLDQLIQMVEGVEPTDPMASMQPTPGPDQQEPTPGAPPISM